MANVIGQRIGGNIVYIDKGAHGKRVVGAIGADVIHYEFLPWVHNIQDEDATGTDPEGFFTTVVEVGTGTSEMDQSNTVGILAQMVTAANENDGISLQLIGPHFEFTSNQSLVYFGIEIDINDIDTSDIFVGLAVEDTALLGAVADGVYIHSLDGATTSIGNTEKNATATASSSLGTLSDNTFHFLEFYFDGTSVYFFVDGAGEQINTTNIPDDVAMTVSLEFLAGSAVASTCDIRQLRVIQIGRT